MAVSYNIYIKNDNTASTELSLHIRMKEKIREKKRECYCRRTELQISRNVQESMAWNSLFKCIKIQRMQIF